MTVDRNYFNAYDKRQRSKLDILFGRLREAMDDVTLERSAGSVGRAAEILGKALEEAQSRDDALLVIAWVDRFIMDCVVGDGGDFGLWEESAETLAKLLKDAEETFTRWWETQGLGGPKAGDNESPAAFSQRLNSYLCIAAAYARDGAELDARLERALAATETNVDWLLSRGCDDDFGKLKHSSRYGFYRPQIHCLTEPLALLAYAAPHIRKAREIHRAYERYIQHLEGAEDRSAGVCGKLMNDAVRARRNLAGYAIDEIGPEYPLDNGITRDVRHALADNPEAPIVVFAGPDDEEGGTFCEIARVEPIEVLNVSTRHWAAATVCTSRESLVDAIARDIRDYGCADGYAPDWTDEQVREAAREKASLYDGDWAPAIAIHAKWKAL